jgi:hypothetical protein
VLDHRGDVAPGVRVHVGDAARDLHHIAGAQVPLLASDRPGGLALDQREALDGVLVVAVRRGTAGASGQPAADREALRAVVEDLDHGAARAADRVSGLQHF